MKKALEEAKRRLAEVSDLGAALQLLQWDQETYMPPKAADGRGHQEATLSAVIHRFATDPALGALLDELAANPDSLTERDKKLVEVARYDYSRATRLPEAFVEEFALAQSRAYEAWVAARKQSDFGAFNPHLAAMVALNRRKADYLGYEESPYDALLDAFERGTTTREVRDLFTGLAEAQRDLVARILASPNRPDPSWTGTGWDTARQWAFSVEVLRDIGYDFDAGRQDKSVHPFSVHFDVHDVRVTTRLSPDEPFMALMGSIHEGGHALYMQGHDPDDRRTPLLDGASLGIHESQSRMWENIIGRSLPFWEHYTDKLRAHFPEKLDGITPRRMYETVNHVTPSLIRVEADECTYNLHICVRFEIETALIAGDLDVGDVPAAWNDAVRRYLGIDVPDDARGCLQDIHWAHGAFAYFPTYALGNVYSAQLFEALLRDVPDTWDHVREGRFEIILSWLRENVHRHGRRKLPLEIIRDATGQDPSPEPYLRYLETKYGEIYGL
jgi:carboxypeptidase Taq